MIDGMAFPGTWTFKLQIQIKIDGDQNTLKTALLIWLCLGFVNTASKWSVLSGYRLKLLCSLIIATLPWFASDKVAEVSEIEIIRFVNQNNIRATILGLITLESVIISKLCWREMSRESNAINNWFMFALLLTPSLGMIPALMLTQHEAFTRWDATDFEITSLITGCAVFVFLLLTVGSIQFWLRSYYARLELAAMLNLLFLPWSILSLGLLQSGGMRTESVNPFDTIVNFGSGMWVPTIAGGIFIFGFMIRNTIDTFMERRLD